MNTTKFSSTGKIFYAQFVGGKSNTKPVPEKALEGFDEWNVAVDMPGGGYGKETYILREAAHPHYRSMFIFATKDVADEVLFELFRDVFKIKF